MTISLKRVVTEGRQTEDQLIRDCLQATAAFYNCVGGVDADLPTEITRSDIDGIVRRLVGNNADMFMTGIPGEDRFGTAPIREAFFALGHTDMIGQLENVQGFISKWNYPNQQSTLSAEWGSVSNSRFLLSSVGSVTANASMNGLNVYNMFFCAKESFANIEQDGHSARFIYRPPIYSGPLAQNITVGFTFASVPRILNDQWLLNLRCTLA